jgi:hypothetical protein
VRGRNEKGELVDGGEKGRTGKHGHDCFVNASDSSHFEVVRDPEGENEEEEDL